MITALVFTQIAVLALAVVSVLADMIHWLCNNRPGKG